MSYLFSSMQIRHSSQATGAAGDRQFQPGCMAQTRSAPASGTKTGHGQPGRASFRRMNRGRREPRTGKSFSLDGRGSYRG
jgi:hypothetical protein